MTTNPTIRPGDDGYDRLRSGYNTAVEHRPDMIVDATSSADVTAAVCSAAEAGRPLAVMNTGHGPSVPADGAVLLRTGRMRHVEVDAARRTARIAAGAIWRDVIDAAGRHDLAPLNGSSPAVGAVGYTLGGGVGHLGRRFGFAADHVRWMEVVTADGHVRQVSADTDTDTDLFWALRGAGANFGVVTAMEVDLFPVTTLVGGELCFDEAASAEVLRAYANWARAAPEAMASSVMLCGYPDDPAFPDQLRGRYVTHVRVAYSGDDQAFGLRLADRLRRIDRPLLDSVRVIPYVQVGTIHHEDTDQPEPAFDRNILLRDFDDDAARVLSEFTGSAVDAPSLVELRAWGGALSRPPAVPNAVAGRDAAYSLIAISDPPAANRARRDELLEAMRPWATGAAYPNFAGVEDTTVDAVRRMYRTQDFSRLQTIKAAYDPHNLFRVNLNIPPA